MWKKTIITVLVLGSMGFLVLGFGLSAESGSALLKHPATENYEPVVVLELFTSQGCSSCPSADRLLHSVKKEGVRNIFTLSYHVDYWNYIGWEDPFSKPQFAEKQRIYNDKFGNRSNYTPQVVVNGQEHFVGSNSRKMREKIFEYSSKKAQNTIEITEVQLAEGAVQFAYALSGPKDGVQLRTLLVLDERSTAVKRGENKNRTLTNANIVVAERITPLSTSAGRLSVKLPAIVAPQESARLVVLAEHQNYDILGAAQQPISP